MVPSSSSFHPPPALQELPSVHRMRRLHDTVRTFLERVRVEADTVHVGAIQLRGDAEIEMRRLLGRPRPQA